MCNYKLKIGSVLCVKEGYRLRILSISSKKGEQDLCKKIFYPH